MTDGSELARRVGVALLGVPLALGAVYLGGWVLGAVVAAVAAVATHEFYGLARARGVRPFSLVGVLTSGGVVLLAVTRPTPAELAPALFWVMAALTLGGLGAAVWRRWPGGEPMSAVGATLLGVAYVGVPLAFVPILRWLPATAPGALTGNQLRATAFVLLPLLATWAGDTAAYFAGRRWGRAKLAPAVSPGKTIVGSVAGLLGSTGGAVLVSLWALSDLPFLRVTVVDALWIGLLLGVAAQLGDLAESTLKREAGVKDSGTLLPGHGGFLDRIDALLFAFPAAWVLVLLAASP